MAKAHPNGEPKGESVLLRSLVTAAYIAITAVSVWFLKGGSLYGGRSAAHVWWYGWVTALSTGLGALPTAFLRTTGGDEDKYWLGLANAMAGGMMTSASAALIIEGVELGVGERAPFTPLQCVAFGGVIGIMFIVASQRILDGSDDVKFSIIEGIDARRALLIVVVMTLHSFSEGIGIGVSFGEQTKESLGMLVTTTLAVHNVPEGFAVSVVLVSKGMSVWGAALWSVMTSIPQPLMAIAAFLFVDSFVLVQPMGLGFAAGAMLWVAWIELFVEAHEACGLMSTATTGLASAVAMGLCHSYLM